MAKGSDLRERFASQFGSGVASAARSAVASLTGPLAPLTGKLLELASQRIAQQRAAGQFRQVGAPTLSFGSAAGIRSLGGSRMSLIGAFGGVLRTAATQVGTAAVQAATTSVIGRLTRRPVKGPTMAPLQIPAGPTQTTSASVLGGLTRLPALISRGAGALTRTLPAAGGRVGRIARGVATVGGAAATGALLFDEFGNVVGRRRRSKRMNAMNAKALRRAIRRVKAGRKICQEIERSLPKRKSAAACAPAFTRRKRKC